MGAEESWAGEPLALRDGHVTLVEGTSFCICGRSGDIAPGHAQGLFFRDTRTISRWELLVEGAPVEVLLARAPEPYLATFVGRVLPTGAQTDLLVERRRLVSDGMREDLLVRNLTGAPATVSVVLGVGADFADLFDVKEGRAGHEGDPAPTLGDSWLRFDAAGDESDGGGIHRGVRIVAPGGDVRPGCIEWVIRVPARGEWRCAVLVHPIVDGVEVGGAFPLDRPVTESWPARRLQERRAAAPHVHISHTPLGDTLQRSLEDLGSLLLVDPADPTEFAVAAGAPWFMALFGRDSLLSSYLAMSLDPTLALGTLRLLAHHQGTTVDDRTEEQPGRILHETRLGRTFPLAHGGGGTYYGTVDATPLFVVLLDEVCRWGIAPDLVQALLPNADRALAWVDEYGDRDGDGFVEYACMTSHGLRNQGWKDSSDGITFADGRLAEPPIALCEVQGYVYAAFAARAHLAAVAGDAELARHWTRRAARLKTAFNDRFWLPGGGWYALALDGDKRPVDALASNLGHCLWSGIVDADKAAAVARHLMSPEMFSGWGVRTLATSMAAYNPMSYHNGSVWPHDNALIVAGLMRYGFVGEARRLATALLDAAAALGHTLPELFSGFSRDEYEPPLPYPTSCSPQAWAAAAPIQLVRTLLRLDPCVPHGQVRFAPAWPSRYGFVTVRGIRVGDGRATLEVREGHAHLTGLGPQVRVSPLRQPE